MPKAILTIKPNITQIEIIPISESKPIYTGLSILLSYTRPGSMYRTFGKKATLCITTDSCFRVPTGLLPQVIRYLEEVNVTYETQGEIISNCLPHTPIIPLQDTKFREYQQHCVDLALTAQRGVFQLPPGSGKTEILIQILHTLGKPALWLSPTTNVLEQTIQRWKLRVGNYKNVTFLLPVSLWKRASSNIKYLEQFEVLVVDECHRLTDNVWYNVALNCPASYRFGVSARPEHKLGNLQLLASIGQTRYKLSYETMYQAGYLLRPKVRMIQHYGETVTSKKKEVPKYYQGMGVPIRTTDWFQLYKEGICNCKQRNQAALQEVLRYHNLGIPPLVITRYKERHAVPFLKLCEKKGLRVTMISGKTKVGQRQKFLDDLISKKYDVIVSTAILSVGQDVPHLSAIINLMGGDNATDTVQLAGRVMRPQGAAYVSDFVDDHNPILQKHTQTRIQGYTETGAILENCTYTGTE